MSKAARQYQKLMDRWLRQRDKRTMSEAQEDRLLEKLDDLWWQMTREEHMAINTKLEKGKKR